MYTLDIYSSSMYCVLYYACFLRANEEQPPLASRALLCTLEHDAILKRARAVMTRRILSRVIIVSWCVRDSAAMVENEHYNRSASSVCSAKINKERIITVNKFIHNTSSSTRGLLLRVVTTVR